MKLFITVLIIIIFKALIYAQTDTAYNKYEQEYELKLKQLENKENQQLQDLDKKNKEEQARLEKEYNDYVNNLETDYNYFVKKDNPQAASIVKGDINYEKELKNNQPELSPVNNNENKEIKDGNLVLIPNGLPFQQKNIRVSSPFSANRYHPILKKNRPHWGIDYACVTGTKIYSTADGVILIAKKSSSYGYYIVVKHGDYTTTYAHLSKLSVSKGDKIKKNKLIGLSGNTGISTGAHLHYEIRKNGVPINPKQFI